MRAETPVIPRRPAVLPALALAAALAAATPAAHAGVLLQPVAAPEWKVTEWLNGNLGTLASLRGRVVLIEFIQLSCPASEQFAVPLFEHFREKYAARNDVVVVAIHSVFEEHERQSPAQLRRFVERHGIRHHVGIDAYDKPGDREPATLRRFDAGGTPHIVVIDRGGQIRFSHVGVFDGATLEAFLDRLLRQPQTPGR